MAGAEPSLADARMVLGVTAEATPAQVASAFRRLAREVHPDVDERHDAAPRFDALVSAYRIALPAAAEEGHGPETSGSGAVGAGRGPTATGPAGRAVHDVVDGVSGTTVWEGDRPILFVSDAVNAPSGRAARGWRR